jgi:hypothetical protein
MCPIPIGLIGTSRRGRALLLLRNPEGIVSRKRPLDRRRAITGTVFGREPANPKTGDDPGRRRIFWWRDDDDTPLSQSNGRKARSIDPANVFGAADADADDIRKLAVAADGFDSSDRSSHTKRRSRILLSSGVRPLTREAINVLN